MRLTRTVVVFLIAAGLAGGALLLGRVDGGHPFGVPRAPKSRSPESARGLARAEPAGPALTAPKVVRAVAFGSTRPLRELPRPKPRARITVRVAREHETRPPRPSTGARDGALQTSVPAVQAPPALATFLGVTQADNEIAGQASVPPDTVGDVGPSHYVEMTNIVYSVYSKAGTRVLGPLPNNTLWQSLPSSSLCRQNNDGDPIVVYDPFANRWVLSQFAWQDNPGSYHMCIAVSKTSNPTGGYWAYDYLLSTTRFNDYPKIGVWPDGYYASFNDFGAIDFLGVTVAAFPRAKLTSGQAASAIKFSTNYPASTEYSLLPADYDGHISPPAGSPEIFAEEAGPNNLKLFAFHANFTTPSSSTFTSVANLTTQSFDEQLCDDPTGFGFCIPQKDTDELLDGLADRLMHRLAYHRLNTGTEALVVNHTVKADSNGRAGVRWYELRKANGSWSIRQQGTYAPADGVSRWMGSSAMDGNGNIAVGYSASSTTLFPSIRFTGRLRTEALGTLEAERTMFAGSGSQTNSSPRWGDYSAMSVDPTDDCTFWYVQEYYPYTDPFDWRTRVGRFRFPSCVGVSRLSPASGPVGTQVTITGVGFTTSSSVKFNGVLASKTYVSPTTLKATVPSGATSGRVSVTTGVNTGFSSATFSVTP